MRRFLRYAAFSAVVLFIAMVTLCGVLAIWFKLPASDSWRIAFCSIFGFMSAVAIIALFGRRRLTALMVIALLFAGMLAWWQTIRPASDGNWSPDVARQVTGIIEGDILKLTNVREFQWRGRDDFTKVWTNRTFDLSQLQTVDVFMSHWAGPELAHLIVSFGFSDDQYLAWSVEVRREVGSEYSPVADFFKANSLVIVAATEQDVVGVRSNVRGEDVQMYRLGTSPRMARTLLEEYVRDANKLSREPKWYNSITTNCTTVVFKMMIAIGDGRSFDWRMIVNGYLPEYAYERRNVNTDVPLKELRELGRIKHRALEAGLGSGFSTAIRQGVLVPANKTK